MNIYDAFRQLLFESAPENDRIKSPIEQKMYAALLWEATIRNHAMVTHPFGCMRMRAFRINPQVREGPYTLDFAVQIYDFGHMGEPFTHIQIAVECDGHEFHERTKEQAAHDKERDRYLQEHAWLVSRFTGSEIYGDADACAVRVFEMAHRYYKTICPECPFQEHCKGAGR